MLDMFALQTTLLRTPKSERVGLVKDHFQQYAHKCINPDTNKPSWLYPTSELASARVWYKDKRFDNSEWHRTGYLAVNMGGRCGYTLLAIACHWQDFELIDFLLEHGANRKIGCDDRDILESAKACGWDLEPVQKSLAYISGKPEIPDMYWAKRVLA